nr:hypothetical protein [Streptomyces sulphureus]
MTTPQPSRPTPHRALQQPAAADVPPQAAGRTLPQRLAELRGAEVQPRPMDARALAALAANPGCHRRALLDAAGVDKRTVAERLGAPAPFGRSQFAFARGHSFESGVTAEGGAALIRLLCRQTGEEQPEPESVRVPELNAAGPAARAGRTALELRAAAARGGWSLLDHPMLSLPVAGAAVHLEPDALAVHPDGSVTVVEIKSFPILDGSADAAKVGAAARQAAVYALALEDLAEVRERALLVCPEDFSNSPTAAPLDLRKQCAATRRQLARLTRIEEIAELVPAGAGFAPSSSEGELAEAVASVPAAYAPECLSTCELAFHCRSKARAAGAVEALGRSVRGELGGLRTVEEVLEAARSEQEPADDPAAAALRRAARLRDAALAEAACR